MSAWEGAADCQEKNIISFLFVPTSFSPASPTLFHRCYLPYGFVSQNMGHPPWSLLIHSVWTSFSITILEPFSSCFPWPCCITMENSFLSPSLLCHSCPSFFLCHCRNFRLYVTFVALQRCLKWVNKSNYLRLLFVHVTDFTNDLPSLCPLAVKLQYLSSMAWWWYERLAAN